MPLRNFKIFIIFALVFVMCGTSFAAARTPRKTEPKTPEKLQEAATAAPAAAAKPEVIPPARIEEAEQAFTRAWDAFIRRDYWRAMEQLDRAQAANIFLVDVYFLRGIVQRRMGELDAAQKSFAGFYEVRTRDEVVPFMIKGTAENKSDIAELVSRTPYPTRWIVPMVDITSAFHTFLNRPYSAKGLGKLSGFGQDLCFADTLGNSLYIRIKKNSVLFTDVNIDSPIVGLLPGDHSIIVLNLSGDVYQISAASVDLIDSLNITVSDAALLSAEEFLVTDPINRNVGLYSLSTLDLLDTWAPASADKFLFEPAAVDCYADWAAIADRANGKIYFLNLRDYSVFSSEEPAVRDLIWSGLGTLISVSDNAEIAAHTIDFAKKTAFRESLRSEVEDAWSLFKYENEIYCANILGTRLWHIKPTPTMDPPAGFLSLYYPKFEVTIGDDNSFSMSAMLSSPFQSWLNSMFPSAQSVWNNSVITTNIFRLPPRTPLALCFARGDVTGLVSNLRVIPTETCSELISKLGGTWTNQRDLITHFVIDSRIACTVEELRKLTAFCMFNGVELDIWARSIPSVELVRASAATGGKVYYSLEGNPVFDTTSNGLEMRIVLPFKLASSGYPDRATLSMYMNIGQATATDWMPVWIDLLRK